MCKSFIINTLSLMSRFCQGQVTVLSCPELLMKCDYNYCIVLKKVYTYWLIILIQVYKLRLILNTVYTFLFLHGWLKRKQALLRSNLAGITPVCDEVFRSKSQVFPGSFNYTLEHPMPYQT